MRARIRLQPVWDSKGAWVNQMRLSATCFLLGASTLLGGCASLLEGFSALWDSQGAAETASSQPTAAVYGVEDNVRETVDIIKTAGEMTRISSHAIRLPSNPLRTITAFDYAFPDDCGGHHFRVYEADGTQILEYAYAPQGGKPQFIRDYISGPSPFIRAGLWTAYDHTGDSVADMDVKFARRGSGILAGTYSQGPVTGLDASAKRVLGAAYDRALRDSDSCGG